MAASLLEPLLDEAALEGDEVFVAMTDFQLDGQRLEWGVMLLPSNKSLALMRNRCRMESVRENALQTIAEFVETPEILARLQKIGIDYAQGDGIDPIRPLQFDN